MQIIPAFSNERKYNSVGVGNIVLGLKTSVFGIGCGHVLLFGINYLPKMLRQRVKEYFNRIPVHTFRRNWFLLRTMGCSLLRLNTLPSIWYTLCMSSLQIYLLYLAFERYKLYTEIKWPNNVYPRLSLTVYISLCGACIPLLFLFTIFGIFKSGNLANDSKKLDSKDKHFIHQVKSLKSSSIF
jgi:hypothetical protein